LNTERPDGHDEIQATADVTAPLICGRFRFGRQRQNFQLCSSEIELHSTRSIELIHFPFAAVGNQFDLF
jgi:hypothetical protein